MNIQNDTEISELYTIALIQKAYENRPGNPPSVSFPPSEIFVF